MKFKATFQKTKTCLGILVHCISRLYNRPLFIHQYMCYKSILLSTIICQPPYVRFSFYFVSFQLISEETAELRHNHATTMAKLAQFKRKHLELSHRILEVMLSVKLV